MAKRPPNTKAGIAPSVRTFATWTPGLIKAAEIAADGGYLRQSANLCEWLLADDRIGPLLRNRTQTLLGLDPSFEPSGDKRRSKRTVRALDAQEDWWASYPEAELVQLHVWGLLLGCSPGQHEWIEHEDHGGRVLPMLEFWHPQGLRYDWHTRRWTIRVAQAGAGQGIGQETEFVAGDGQWVLHTPYGPNRPWSNGLWRNLSRYALLKLYAVNDWAQHSEKASLLVATKQVGGEAMLGDLEVETAEQRAELAEDLYARGRDGVAALPPGWDAKLVESTANTKNLYDAQIEMANKAITIAIRGGNLTTDVGKSGSRAAAETQAETGDHAALKFDAQSLTTTIHDQSLVWWAEFNFGDPRLAPWPVYPTEEGEDLTEKATTAGAAAGAAKQMQDLGLEVDAQGFIETFGLSEWVKPPPKGDVLPKPATPEPEPETTDDPPPTEADDDTETEDD